MFIAPLNLTVNCELCKEDRDSFSREARAPWSFIGAFLMLLRGPVESLPLIGKGRS